MDYTSTSRIRRRVKTKLSRFKNKIQGELSRSLNDLTTIEGHQTSHFKKYMVEELTASSLSLNCIAGKECESIHTNNIRWGFGRHRKMYKTQK